MYPIIPFLDTVSTYQIMALIGVLTTGFYCVRVSKRLKYDDTDTIVFLLFTSIGIMIGGGLLFALTNFSGIIFVLNNLHLVNSWDTFVYVLQAIFGGSVFYGGLLGALSVAAIYLRRKPERKYLVDLATPGIPLFHFFGRIGCFLGGCCYGIPSPFGFTFTNSLVIEANGIRRFPVSLLEASFNMGLFIFLSHCFNKGKYKDKLLYVYLGLYATGRFFIEFLRGDAVRGIWLFLSTSQIISLAILTFILIKYIRYRSLELKSSNP